METTHYLELAEKALDYGVMGIGALAFYRASDVLPQCQSEQL